MKGKTCWKSRIHSAMPPRAISSQLLTEYFHSESAMCIILLPAPLIVHWTGTVVPHRHPKHLVNCLSDTSLHMTFSRRPSFGWVLMGDKKHNRKGVPKSKRQVQLSELTASGIVKPPIGKVSIVAFCFRYSGSCDCVGVLDCGIFLPGKMPGINPGKQRRAKSPL